MILHDLLLVSRDGVKFFDQFVYNVNDMLICDIGQVLKILCPEFPTSIFPLIEGASELPKYSQCLFFSRKNL